MKIDGLGCVVRERYPDGEWANWGDSCAETSRLLILGQDVKVHQFIAGIYNNKHEGYLRHPKLLGVPQWGIEDFSNDQAFPLLMAFDLIYPASARAFREANRWRIVGTKTFLSVGLLALVHEWFWCLNVANVIQGWMFNLAWRFGDGGKLERNDGQVQDWLNYVCTYLYLKKRGKWATLNQPVWRCMAAVFKYYMEGEDAEPSSEWIVDHYREALA